MWKSAVKKSSRTKNEVSSTRKQLDNGQHSVASHSKSVALFLWRIGIRLTHTLTSACPKSPKKLICKFGDSLVVVDVDGGEFPSFSLLVA